MSATYEVGSAVTLGFTVTVNGVLTNATPVLVVTLPDGSTASPSITNPSTGTYSANYVATQNGLHVARWTATGGATAAQTETFTIGGLASLADFKQQINFKTTSTTTDAELQRFLDAAVPVIEFIAGPVLPRKVVERRDGGGDTILLRTRPLLVVTSVVEYRGSTTTSLAEAATPAAAGTNTFTVNTDIGAITRRTSGGGITSFPWGVDNVVITYSSGLAAVPPNVRSAALMQAGHMFQKSQLGGRPQLAAGGVADYTNGWGYGIPNAVREYLEPNRRLPGLA